jgi:hypothetical protein
MKKYYDNSGTLTESDDVKLLINFIKKAYKDIIIFYNNSKEIEIKDTEYSEDAENSETKEDIFSKNKEGKHIYCYDTIKLYEYILFMIEKGKLPVNLLTGHNDLLTDDEIDNIQ